ncbi:MAG: c-type cytochrome domain-containing protein [Chitinophagales bacterium]
MFKNNSDWKYFWCLLVLIFCFSRCTWDKAPSLSITDLITDTTGNGGDSGGGGDSGNGGDSGGSDTTGEDNSGGIPCDPDSVYFEADILPILISNCAKSGCHDEASHKDGIKLNSYENVINTADIEPYDLDAGKLYEVITESDPDDRMPPPPNDPLSSEEISLIALWIMQGAKDLHCDENSGGVECDLSNVTYSGTVAPILSTYCIGCHSEASASGGVVLATYSGVSTVALDGRLVGVITHSPGYVPMPFGGNKLPDCEIEQITEWVNNGAPNN